MTVPFPLFGCSIGCVSFLAVCSPQSLHWCVSQRTGPKTLVNWPKKCVVGTKEEDQPLAFLVYTSANAHTYLWENQCSSIPRWTCTWNVLNPPVISCRGPYGIMKLLFCASLQPDWTSCTKAQKNNFLRDREGYVRQIHDYTKISSQGAFTGVGQNVFFSVFEELFLNISM